MNKTLKILLVDGNSRMLLRLATTLRALNCTDVIGFSIDVNAALESAKHLDPDVVILSAEMLDGEGIDKVKKIRMESGSEIILLSFTNNYGDLASDITAIDYLVRPLQPALLQQSIDRVRRRVAQGYCPLSHD